MQEETKSKINKAAYMSILLLGIVSLMGDVVYEGSGGIIPDYLKFLGATGVVAGLVVGFGEFLGNAMRFFSGLLADTTRAYWLFIFLGYGLIVSVPLLGVSSTIEIAIILILLERLGKALRAPSRDAVLSIVSKDVGAGKAFGIHEFLDQVGAILGPLLVATLMFSTNNNYSYTFSFLFIPFLILLAVLAYTYKRIGRKTAVEPSKAEERKEKLPKFFYIYTLAVLVNTVGLMSAKLILFRASELLNPQGLQWIVPLMYLLIQGVDAPTALIAGYAYDKFGIKILTLPFALSVFPTLFAMSNNELPTLIAASAFSGLVLGMQESIYRAAVSQLTPVSSRGTAYGLFNVTYGFGELISGGIFGLLIDLQMSLVAVMFYAVAFQIMAIALLLRIKRE
ncbi:MAG: MFS transporter [Candidatus Bathyarchaeota archaeon]|jgi:MFS family permease|nr:MFS transporter [Candidatus Bathyarchaeota archaeon]